MIKKAKLKLFLDYKATQYNTPEFIKSDPAQIPHRFSKKEDIEIAGFLSATIAWGNRKSILNTASSLMELLEHSSFDFVMNHSEEDLICLENFIHRTFNGTYLRYFVQSLKNLYLKHDGLEAVFAKYAEVNSLAGSIHPLNNCFLNCRIPQPPRNM